MDIGAIMVKGDEVDFIPIYGPKLHAVVTGLHGDNFVTIRITGTKNPNYPTNTKLTTGTNWISPR
jgi:hypothetical protein